MASAIMLQFPLTRMERFPESKLGLIDQNSCLKLLFNTGEPPNEHRITIHPKLQHYGLITANVEAMRDWYRKVLGMNVNHRSKIPAIAQITNRRHARAIVAERGSGR